MQPFHVAVPVNNLNAARTFYKDVLGCQEGRSSADWVDFNLFGHQFVIHYKEGEKQNIHFSDVDNQAVPIPHYGVVLKMEDWKAMANRLKDYGVDFIIQPYIRFKDEPGEQATMFFLDPCGNALEFKAFNDIGQLFVK
ncbi:MAG: VOC family protein [Saprospiraceae bacterium]